MQHAVEFMNINIMGLKFDVDNALVGLGLIILFIVLALTLGVYLLSLAINYVFYLLNLWKIMSQTIKITFMQTFWLILASLAIRVLLFFKIGG
jgi:hypothetical protein